MTKIFPPGWIDIEVDLPDNDTVRYGIGLQFWYTTTQRFADIRVQRAPETSPGSGVPDTGNAVEFMVWAGQIQRAAVVEDILPNDGARRFYRCKAQSYQWTDSGWGGWVDAVPCDLDATPIFNVVTPPTWDWVGGGEVIPTGEGYQGALLGVLWTYEIDEAGDEATLRWVAPGAIEVEVWEDTGADGIPDQIATGGDGLGREDSYTITGVTVGTLHTYWLLAKYDDGSSSDYVRVDVQRPEQPTLQELGGTPMHVGTTPPGSPAAGDTWVDTSLNPPVLKRYTGAAWDEVGILNQGALATLDTVSETTIDDDSISTPKLKTNSVTANEINVATLSAIVADVGVLTAGVIQHTSGLRYIDLDASGNEPFIKHDNFTLEADGTAVFGGAVGGAFYTGGLTLDSLKPAEGGADATAGKSLTVLTDRNAGNISETASRKWAGETGADVTANNAAATIIGQGTLATLNTINNSVLIDNGVIVADHIAVDSLAAIKAVLGNVATGRIDNLASSPTGGIRLNAAYSKPSSWTSGVGYIDFAATGNSLFLYHPALQIEADGDATFYGDVDATDVQATTGTFAGITCESFTGGSRVTISNTDPEVELSKSDGGSGFYDAQIGVYGTYLALSYESVEKLRIDSSRVRISDELQILDAGYTTKFTGGTNFIMDHRGSAFLQVTGTTQVEAKMEWEFKPNGSTLAMRVDDANSDVQIGAGLTTTSRSTGFIHMPTTAGVPTGTPGATGRAAMCIDTSTGNGRIYVRVGTTWRYVALT